MADVIKMVPTDGEGKPNTPHVIVEKGSEGEATWRANGYVTESEAAKVAEEKAATDEKTAHDDEGGPGDESGDGEPVKRRPGRPPGSGNKMAPVAE